MPARLEHGLCLSQLQWFAALSTLCSIINDQETVSMSAISIHAGAVAGGVSELRSELLQLMHPPNRKDLTVCPDSFRLKLDSAVSLAARFAVRHELSPEEVTQLARYLVALFPCGAVAPPAVERSDGKRLPVPCGQCQLFHKGLHRSGTTVTTIHAGWLQRFSEWLLGGVAYAWPGEYVCHESLTELCELAKVDDAIKSQVEELKVERCLQGLCRQVGVSWVLKAHSSFVKLGLPVRCDASRLCLVCCSGAAHSGERWSWTGDGEPCLPVCKSCHGIMEEQGLCKGSSGALASQPRPGCSGCGSSSQSADYCLQPCKCLVCRSCADKTLRKASCPNCASPVRWLADNRALMASGWRAAPRMASASQRGGCGICVS
eukprot:TRINITY_DN93530_c0_g1_i1.p1 TRINITY_DN93530_c0_g1~~TRINITY_DN93530_c0_g1_i1.p1  ORF type:complete len:396 (+),score=78.73 TRINITY_DN93530_c0_g1_i1:66-1190(+)